jgi:hypothetical protein
MDLSGLGIDVKLKEIKKDEPRTGARSEIFEI